MRRTSLRKLGHFAAEHLTWLSVCGLVAVITGFTPEEWVAHLAETLRVSGVVDGHWPRYLDIRAVLVAVGVGVIVTDVLLKRRAASRQLIPQGGSTSEAGPSFSDGDWITAAIVAPERAVTAMKKARTALHDRMSGSRTDVVGHLQAAVDQEVSRFRTRFEAGGTTDEARCEACIAKITADLIEREGAALLFELMQRPEVDPNTAFSRMIKRLGKAG